MSFQEMKPIFSVVMPIYNASKYIRKSVASVLDQSFKSFELICVDDGTPDDSIRIVQQYDDPRIKVVRQKNRGLAGARNTGINASQGIFVAFLDADDAWHPKKLEKHFYHLQCDGMIGVSYSSSEFMDEDGERMGIGQYPKVDGVTAVDVFCRNPVGNGSSAVIRKSLLLQVSRMNYKHGGYRREYFDEELRQSEDIDFWVRIALTSQYRFSGLPNALTYYRVNSSGLSANLNNQYESWLNSVNRNRNLNVKFFETWFSLASAFQKRYLARRAIKSGNPKEALLLLHASFSDDIRVIIDEPLRTAVTYCCALLGFLPKPLFNTCMKIGMSSNFLRRRA